MHQALELVILAQIFYWGNTAYGHICCWRQPE